MRTDPRKDKKRKRTKKQDFCEEQSKLTSSLRKTTSVHWLEIAASFVAMVALSKFAVASTAFASRDLFLAPQAFPAPALRGAALSPGSYATYAADAAYPGQILAAPREDVYQYVSPMAAGQDSFEAPHSRAADGVGSWLALAAVGAAVGVVATRQPVAARRRSAAMLSVQGDEVEVLPSVAPVPTKTG